MLVLLARVGGGEKGRGEKMTLPEGALRGGEEASESPVGGDGLGLIGGFHHLTACVGAAQEDIDFFTGVVGQRMVKQTVLFDGTNPV